MTWIEIEDQGVVMVARIVTIGHAETAPMRRAISALPEEKVVVLTGGRRRQSVIVLDSGHLVITALSVQRLTRLLASNRRGARHSE